MRLLVTALLLAVATVCAAAPRFDNPDMRLRYQNLTAELRCVICLNQNIASSSAPLARDMRQLVAERMRAGDTDAEIKDILVERYGTFVLYDPPFGPTTWVLWLGPAALLLMGLLIAALMLSRGRRTRAEPVTVDQTRLDQLLHEDEREDRE